MIAELGHFALILALLTAGAQGTLSLWGAAKGKERLMALSDRAAIVQFYLIAFSFLALTLVFIQSDFSVKLAATHSHSMKPLIYKISGVWGNHEGSILLWTLMLALYGALIPPYGQHLPKTLKTRAVGIQGLLGVGFLAFILFTSNPFERLDPVPLDGLGLNPLLQDPGLAIHPPLLYMGYVGFSVAFSFSVAALIEGKVDAIWARWVRPWVIIAWSFLTLGITIGSVWAYYELGWGGWWMWDPVENVSFMPWLLGTALLHSIMVLGTRHQLASWTILLGISAFSLSLIGTFVVRSGVLVSVHAFAVDPARGVFILALLMAATGGALTLYAIRAKTLKGPGGFTLLSRQGGLVLNNLLLVVATATVFLGTFYPLFMDAMTGEKITVAKPYFDITFAPIMLVLILFMGAAPLLKWTGKSRESLKKLAVTALILAVVIVTGTTFIGKSFLGGIGLFFAAYLAFATCLALYRRTQNFKNFRQQPAATYGFFFAHFGMAIFTVGAVVMSVWAQEDAGRINIGESITTAGYEFTLKSMDAGARENYQFLAASIDISKNGKEVKTLKTEQRFYPVREMITTEAGFHYTAGPTLFAAIGEGDNERGWKIRANYHPFVTWIWFGALLMALAGFISLTDRRLRFSAELDSDNPMPDTQSQITETEATDSTALENARIEKAKT